MANVNKLKDCILKDDGIVMKRHKKHKIPKRRGIYYPNIAYLKRKGEKDFTMVLKAMSYNDKKKVDNEIKLTKMLDKHGLGPKFHESFICTHDGEDYMIMITEKLDVTLADLIRKEKGLSKDLQQRLEKFTEKLAQTGITHEDYWAENIMLDKTGKMKVIDLEKAVYNKDHDWKKTSNEMMKDFMCHRCHELTGLKL